MDGQYLFFVKKSGIKRRMKKIEEKKKGNTVRQMYTKNKQHAVFSKLKYILQTVL